MKTKYYDKEIHARNESIKGILVVITSFILGFAAGCVAINQELENKIEDQESIISNQYIELDSLRETIHMYKLYGK